MQLLTLDEARVRLDPIAEAVLVKPCLQAVKEWNKIVKQFPSYAATFSPTTRAGIIHDLTTRAVRGALPSGARELTAYGFFVIIVSEDLAIRYKYVVSGQPRNVATDKQDLLATHKYDAEMVEALVLDGSSEPPTLVTCGYRLDAAGQISRLSVQCDYGKSTLWRYFVYGEAGTSDNYETLPLDPTDTLGTTVIRSTRKDASRDDEAAR
ncbi:MAG: hypothetical protein M3N95_01775 [Actinomycetota bacterium]|nr:hypothetical protein [Actinomycetota bacterium]